MTEQVQQTEIPSTEVLPAEEFVASIHQIGADYYHDKHPFHRRMYRGDLSKEEIQGWVANRFYYQIRISKGIGGKVAPF